jgi:glycosyltransferase involved in cell wall biosynthesis
MPTRDDNRTPPIICLASSVSVPSDTPSMLYLRALAVAGYRTVAVMPGELPQHLVALGVEHVRLPKPRASFWYGRGLLNAGHAVAGRLRTTLFLFSVLRRIRPDVCISIEPDSWAAAVIAKSCWGSRVVVNLREIYEERARAFPVVLRPVIRFAVRYLMRILSRSTDEILHHGIERQEVHSYLGRNGVSVSPFPRAADMPHHHGTRPAEAVVKFVHAGALRATYAGNELLRAFAIARRTTPAVKLVVLGGVANNITETSLLSALQLAGALDVLPPMPFAEVVVQLANSDVGISLVLPVDRIHYLAQPSKLFEYLASGLPVLAADVPTIRRIVSSDDCGLLVDAADENAIAAAIVRLVVEEPLRRRLGENAARAAVRYTWEEEEPKLLAVVRQAVEKSTAARSRR